MGSRMITGPDGLSKAGSQTFRQGSDAIAIDLPATEVAGGETALTPSLALGFYETATIFIASNGNTVTVRYQLSPDNTNWYDPKAADGGTLGFDVDKNWSCAHDERICISVSERALYIRLELTCAAGVSTTVSGAVVVGA